ncbi:c-type cytochrome [Minwuia sp.]|uniref:c-type cytochrome n=1 Tax=Minwuia sp. TaxID=2493630 RepID=UPI003A941100
MDSMFFNKIAGAVLLVILIGFAITELSHVLVHPHEEDTVAIAVPEIEATGETAAAEPEETVSIGALMMEADLVKGEKVFKKCAACHTVEQGGAKKTGPNLFGILNNDIAAVPDFSYSATLAELEGDWTYEALNGFLADPKGYAKGTKMAFAGLKKDGDRADLILYLRSFGDAETPLPEPEVAAEPEAPAEQPAAQESSESTEQPAAE